MTVEVQAVDTYRPRLLFVDDEQRVLNSMRIMFRRQFELFSRRTAPRRSTSSRTKTSTSSSRTTGCRR